MTTKLKVICSEGQDDQHESRPWWEPPYVVYGFANRRVRSRIERLMGNYVVEATNKNFMLRLKQRSRDVYEEDMKRRIQDREIAEVEREKRLILEGKMPVEEAPQALSNHPVFQIAQLAKKILEQRRKKAEAKTRHKRLKRFDYALLEGIEEADVGDSEMLSCIDMDESDADRARKFEEKEALFSEGLGGFSDEDYDRIKYVDPLVEDLEEAETVDDLYSLADEIVGPLSGKTCGGLVK
uniref:Uncharacterized protein n=1 Tax=Graphocephala atropunctata TaxID=36148 RepID=A0A1B6KYD6_9HEMI